MNDHPDLMDFEHRGWAALSSSPEQARAFYSSILDDDAQMLFPGEMRLVGKQEILEMMGGLPWQSFQISDVQQIALSDTGRVITYKVIAQRTGSDPYRALICSVYALRGGVWQLVVHQQTRA